MEQREITDEQKKLIFVVLHDAYTAGYVDGGRGDPLDPSIARDTLREILQILRTNKPTE